MRKLNILLIDNVDLPLKTAYKFPHASPPIGVQYLASYLRLHCSLNIDNVRVLSLPLVVMEKHDPTEYVLDELRRRTYHAVGIRSLTSGRDALEIITSRIKDVFPDLPVIVGGPYASDSPALILNDHRAVDYTCSHEGEEVLRQFVEKKLVRGEAADDIPGLGMRGTDGTPRINERMPWLDVDTLPLPDYTDVDLPRFSQVENPMRILNGETWAPLFTQRGCPYRCTYCHEGFGKLSRERSVDNVLGEIRWLHHEKGVTHFAIIDDIFNINKDRAKQVMRAVVRDKLKVHFSFPNALRGDIMDTELVDLLVEAGTVCIHYAVESASPRIQKWIKKNLRLERLNKIIDYTSQYDVLLRGFYMVGFPDETEDELRATIDHAIASQFTETYFSILCMWPGTKIYDAALRDGLIPEGAWTSSTSHDLKNNGFRYPESLLASERLRGYGHTHFASDRVRKNMRIFSALGVPNETVIEKEVRYAQLLREGWSGSGPNPFVPEPFILETLLEVGDGATAPSDAYVRVRDYVDSRPNTERPPFPSSHESGGRARALPVLS